ADLLSDLRLCQFIEPGKVLRRFCIIAGKLVGARQAEFSREMERIQRKTFFKSRYRLIVEARLRVKLADEIQRVRITGIEPEYLFESFYGSVRLRKCAIGNAEVVPGTRTLWLPSCGIEENIARLSKLLVVQQRDTLI